MGECYILMSPHGLIRIELTKQFIDKNLSELIPVLIVAWQARLPLLCFINTLLVLILRLNTKLKLVISNEVTSL